MTAANAMWGWFVWILAVALLLTFAWMLWRARREAADLRVTHLRIDLDEPPKGSRDLRLLQLSDLHWGMVLYDMDGVLRVAREFAPDAILLTGDLVEGGREGVFDLEPLAALARIAPAFYVYGNAEHRNEFWHGRLDGRFARVGLRRLDNEHELFEANRWRVVLAGVDDPRRGHPDFDAALRDVPAADLCILLAHAPTVWHKVVGRPVDLMLSGHTHAGQVRLPLIGPTYSHSMAERLVMSGLFRLPEAAGGQPVAIASHHEVVASGRAEARHRRGEPALLYVTRGLGTVLFQGRIGCPPEIVCITVTGAEGDERDAENSAQ